MGRSWDGKSFFCGNKYHNRGGCLRNLFLSQATAWYLFPTFIWPCNPKENILFLCTRLCCFHFPRGCSQHQHEGVRIWKQNCLLCAQGDSFLVTPTGSKLQSFYFGAIPDGSKNCLFQVFYLLKHKSQQCRNLLSMAHSRGRVGGLLWISSQTQLCWDSRKFWFWIPRPQMVQPWKSSWPKHFATQPSKTHFVGAVAHLFGFTSTCQMGLSCWFFAQTGAAASHWICLP